MAIPANPPSNLTNASVGSSSSVMQSHSRLPLQQSALADCERGVRAKAAQAGLDSPDDVVVFPLQLLHGRPRLPTLPNVLPLVFTDQTVAGRVRVV